MNTLKDIVGEENYLDSKIDIVVYSSDASTAKGTPKSIIFPTSAEQVQKIVRYVVRTNTNLVIRGGGSGLSGGAVPQDSIVLDLSKLNKIIEINKKEKYAIVEAGVILDELNSALEPDLTFPVRPSSHSIATIGGMIATNAAGNNAIKYGWTRNWIKEILVIDGTGKMFDVKGEDIKNFCGKEGTTGIILEAKLIITEKQRIQSMNYLKFDDIDTLVETVKKHKQNPNVSTMEFFNRTASDLAGIDKSYHLVIGFESQEGAVKEDKRIQEILKLRESLGPICSGAGYTIMEDPRVNEDSLSEFIKWIETKEIPCFGHIGVGIFHPRFPKDSQELIREMFDLVRKTGGKVSGEHGIGLTKKPYAEKSFVEEVKRLKQEYDPESILNRGKIV